MKLNPQNRQLWFDIANTEAVNPAAYEAIEQGLPPLGASVIRLDMPSRTLAVEVTDTTLTDSSIEAMVASFGFQVCRRKEDTI